jgi:hypothetical protein
LLRVSDPRDYRNEPEKGRAVLDHLNKVLEADGLAITILDGKPQLITKQLAGVVVTSFVEKTALLDFDTVQLDISRALASAQHDPEDAVTAACSLIESVCRSILIELKLPLPAKKDVDGLIRAVQEPLNLSPGRMDLPAEIENDIRQVFGGLTSVAKGIGALRTHAGDAHGREKGFRRIDSRIARFAINAASSIALFLIETWERQQHRALPLRREGHEPAFSAFRGSTGPCLACRERARPNPLLGVLRRQHPQQAHAPRLRPGDTRVPGLV